MRVVAVVFVTLYLLAGSAAAPALAGDRSSAFSSRVAPVLQRRCFSCHNGKEHKGGFSLEMWEDVENSGYVVAGDPESSYLLEVITSQGGERAAMPKDSDPLSDAEVEAVRKWIADGAVWPEGYRLEEPQITDRHWWSWRPLERPIPPALSETERTWARTPIDAFILAKLRAKGLSPSPEAGRRVLVRRLYFDLTGLPPSPAEVERFVSDPDPLAYEKLVDRLLDSPRYGERWARHWLDVVHYGDTHGYDKDKPRPHAWPYRDYVIRALNEDKPYWRFVQEQVAGDVLWPDSVDGITATGFIAAGPWDLIGHAEVPETKYDGKVARNLDRDDMVSNTMNTFCSLTIQCARCHNHKLDAVTMTDYYRLQAVFAALDRADRPYDADPAVARRRGELTERKQKLEADLAAVQKEIDAKKTPELAQLEEAIARLEAAISADSSSRAGGDRPAAYGYHSQVADGQDEVKWVQIDLGHSAPIDHVLLFGADEYGWADFGFPHRFRVEASDDAEFTGARVLADYTAGDFPRPGAAPVVIEAGGAKARYVRVTATQLWSRRQKDAAPTNDWIFALDEMIVLSEGGPIRAKAVTAKDSIEALPRWGRQNLIDGQTSRGPVPGDSEALLALAHPTGGRTELEAMLRRRDGLEQNVIGTDLLQRRSGLVASIKQAESEIAALPPQQLVYAGTVHNGSGAFRGRAGLGPREIRVLHRGDVNKPGELVAPGVVPLIPDQPVVFDLAPDHEEGQRRVALARWITHRDNPLTWRSIVNRVWLYHFGRGIVDTPNDFGRGGRLPTHPELLDWLAVEFRDGGQSLKALHRLICTSAVYRQASNAECGMSSNAECGVRNAELKNSIPHSVDSGNTLLWRINRRRLEAEEIRDATLFAAGKLNLAMGGPGFMDFAIERPEHSPHYQYHLYDPNDPATHRRAVYRFLVRSQPQPFMTTLDCADPSMSVPKREETLTALQALAMLNNRFMIAMAEHFAARLQREANTVPEQITLGFQLTTGREPTPEERDELTSYAQEFGLANACRVLLNLNEFVFVD